MHEFELIKKFFLKLSNYNKNALDLNDDIFFDKSKKLAISVDTYIEGTHFLNFDYPDLVIKKILRSSISDLICKGVIPKFYFISGSGDKKSFSAKNLKKISKSLSQEQKKYSIYLSGGDTTYSKKLSFTITVIGYSNKIIYRNKAKLHDDIYVTGNLGDSFIGLMILKKKINLNNKLTSYFKKSFFFPKLHINFTKKLLSFANTSIDISDGLIADLEKLINKQKVSYKIYLNDVPVSKNLKELISSKKISKKSCISQGDDYQILFTAPKSKSGIIHKTCNSLGIKISKIGKICSPLQKSQIINEKNVKITIKNKGYFHRF